MSRYTFTNKDNKVIAYGYDRPLRSYFITVYDPSKEWKESNTEEQNNEAIQFDESGAGVEIDYASTPMMVFTKNGKVLSNGGMIEKLEQLGCTNKEHLMSIASDITF
jgi:hypothetical protein